MEQPELPFYDERSDEMDEDVIVQPESSIDRMQWSTTTEIRTPRERSQDR